MYYSDLIICSLWWINLTEQLHQKKRLKGKGRPLLICIPLRFVCLVAEGFGNCLFRARRACQVSPRASWFVSVAQVKPAAFVLECFSPGVVCPGWWGFVTNSIMWWRLSLWFAVGSGAVPRVGTREPLSPQGSNGRWKRSLERHSVHLVTVPLREQSPAPCRRAKATSRLFLGSFSSLSLWSTNSQLPWDQVQPLLYGARRISHPVGLILIKGCFSLRVRKGRKGEQARCICLGWGLPGLRDWWVWKVHCRLGFPFCYWLTLFLPPTWYWHILMDIFR